jgi:hypothetical protein
MVMLLSLMHRGLLQRIGLRRLIGDTTTQGSGVGSTEKAEDSSTSQTKAEAARITHAGVTRSKAPSGTGPI